MPALRNEPSLVVDRRRSTNEPDGTVPETALLRDTSSCVSDESAPIVVGNVLQRRVASFVCALSEALRSLLRCAHPDSKLS